MNVLYPLVGFYVIINDVPYRNALRGCSLSQLHGTPLGAILLTFAHCFTLGHVALTANMLLAQRHLCSFQECVVAA